MNSIETQPTDPTVDIPEVKTRKPRVPKQVKCCEGCNRELPKAPRKPQTNPPSAAQIAQRLCLLLASAKCKELRAENPELTQAAAMKIAMAKKE